MGLPVGLSADHDAGLHAHAHTMYYNDYAPGLVSVMPIGSTEIQRTLPS